MSRTVHLVGGVVQYLDGDLANYVGVMVIYTDVVITQDDLPEPWTLLASPVDHERQRALELALGFDSAEGDPVSWDKIRNEETGVTALLRMVATRDDLAGAAVSSLVLLPPDGAMRIAARTLRSLPLAAIEKSADSRVHHLRYGLGQILASQVLAGDYVAPDPVGANDGSAEFYSRVSALWLHEYENGNPHPTNQVALINDVPVRTAQRWLTEARKRGLLPKGLSGRSGSVRASS